MSETKKAKRESRAILPDEAVQILAAALRWVQKSGIKVGMATRDNDDALCLILPGVLISYDERGGAILQYDAIMPAVDGLDDDNL